MTQDQWTCRECGRTHQLAMLTCDHGGEIRTPLGHQHEWAGYATTGGVSCRICGQRPPEQPNTTISYVNT